MQRVGEGGRSASDSPSPVSSGSDGVILVVDDVPANLLAIDAALGEYASRIVKAESGQAALRRVLDHNVVLVLLDVQLPDMDGFEVARLLRARERNHDTPIIFITAHNQSDRDLMRGYSLGAVDFLHKPIVEEILVAKVSVLLTLQDRTEQLRRHERLEAKRLIAAERQHWEQEALRREMVAQTQRAEELAETIRELEQTEAKLHRTNRQLAEVDQRKDEFLAILAHELRNPLAPLAAGLELLKDEPLSRGGAKTCEAMDRQLDHMTRLVDDLLDISRINSGRIQLRRESVDLLDVAQRALNTAEPLIKQRGHELELKLSDKPVWVEGDDARLVQVISNLLNNAARYTQTGGKIEFSLAREGENAQILIKDNGRGIPKESLEDIFEMFVRNAHDEGGLGIGLSLVDRLVREHGGTVGVDSAGSGKGSEFRIQLPTVDTANPRRPSRPEDSPGIQDMRVTLIDDNPDIRELVAAALERHGAQVECAATGEEGLSLILDSAPHIAVIDVGLPDIDGCEVARRVRKQLGPELPLVAMTGYGQAEDQQRVREAGFDQHLVKPVKPKTLVRVLAELVSRAVSDTQKSNVD